MTSKPAALGGTPVRSRPLPGGPYTGAYVLGDEERQALNDLIDSQSLFRYYGPGPLYRVRELEKAFSQYTGAAHSLAVTSGTAALVVGLRALGVGPGDEVIVPGWTFVASPLAIVAAGAVPIFAEVDDSFTLDPDRIEERITPRTRAIMAVHLAGTSCDMDRIGAVASRHDLLIIEDCAQSTGARWQGRSIGTLGDAGAFSLQLNKMITAGEGGFVTTDDPVVFERAVRCHDQGMFNSDFQGNIRDERGESQVDDFCGENYRMNELTGAVALEQLKKLPGLLGGLRRLHNRLVAGVSDLPGIRFRRSPDPEGDTGGRFATIFETREERDRFLEFLGAEGVGFRAMYNSRPVYLTPRIREQRSWHPKAAPWHPSHYDGKVSYEPGLCPQTEDYLGRHAMVSINPLWTERDVDDVVEAMQKVWPYIRARSA